MNPVAHFFTGWVFANCFDLEQRDRALITLACVAPDVDGLGVIPELLTRNSSHPLLWFPLHHHSLHNLTFALVIAVLVFALAAQKWKTGLLALLSFHLHLFEDVLGSRGPDDYQWPISYLAPFSSSLQLAWRGQWECPDRDRAVAGHTLAGMAERILAAGDGLGRSRQFPGYSAAAALSGEDNGLKGFSCAAYPRSFRNFED
jgi:inner membrane protein